MSNQWNATTKHSRWADNTRSCKIRWNVTAQHGVYNEQVSSPFCFEIACSQAVGCPIMIDGGTNIECIPE